MTLRAWQREALDSFAAADYPRDWLVVATPGAGKTTFALTLARDLVHRQRISQVVVICPTDHLRAQWAHAAAAAGIPLTPRPGRRTGSLREGDYFGYVTTYAQIAQNPLLHRGRITPVRTMVIIDEIHHAGDALVWGAALRTVAENAMHRLALTGTPWRTSEGEAIPFVRYARDDTGLLRSQADYTYGYRDALRAGIVRPVLFAAYSGTATWSELGESTTRTLGRELSASQELETWRRLLDPAGDWIADVIAAAHERLQLVRSEGGMPDAAGMLLAGDQESARAYVPILHRITGQRPVLILSDDPASSKKIDAFRSSDAQWCVAVRQISEGVDVPRLAVGVWATSYRTPLFFAQAVGRFVRARRRGEAATVFLPAVRALLALAAELEVLRDHALREINELGSDDDQAPDVNDMRDAAADEPDSVLVDAQATFQSVLAGQTVTTGEDGSSDSEYMGLLEGLLSPQQTAAVLRARDAQRAQERRRRRPAEVAVDEPEVLDEPDVEHPHEEAMRLRRSTNGTIAAIARITGEPHAGLHAKLRNRVPGPPQSEASLAILRKRYQTVARWAAAAGAKRR